MAQSQSNEIKNPARSFGSIPGRYNSRNIFSITPGSNASQLGAGLTLPPRGGSAGTASTAPARLPTTSTTLPRNMSQAFGGANSSNIFGITPGPNASQLGAGMAVRPDGSVTAAPVSSQSTPTNQNFSSTGTGGTAGAIDRNAMSSQLDAIRNQALGIQEQLNNMNAGTGGTTGATGTTGTTGSTTGFSGILDSLLGASKPTREQERTRKEMERIARENKAIADNAARISEQYGQEIARVGDLGAGAVAGNLSTGTNVVGAGNAAIASQSASQRMNALAQAQQAALKGTEQQLTGQQQTAEAFQPSLQAALTQQQQQLSGLGTAAGL